MNKITKNSIIKKISEGKTVDALEDALFILPQETKIYNKYILLQGQWKTAENQIHLGLDDRKVMNLEFNRISNAAIEFLNEISDSVFEQQEQYIASCQKTRDMILQLSKENLVEFKYDIFFCFSNKDINEARKVCDELRGYGLQVFFSADDLRLKGGHQFSQVIDEALEYSRHFLLYSTLESMHSEWVNLEYTTFHDQIHIANREKRKFFIFEGLSFTQELLRITYRNNQRVKNVENILHILLPNFQNLLTPKDIHKYVDSNTNHEKAKDISIEGSHNDKINILQKLNFEPDMVFVEGGSFSLEYSWLQRERGGILWLSYVWARKSARHDITLNDFSISKYPITQAQWKAVMGKNPSYFKGDNLPVENVNWLECQEYIKKLNEKAGKNYRLPTEGEWKFAAHGGLKSNNYTYSGSNKVDEVSWHIYNSERKTHPVGSKKANELGLYDMESHVQEWCNDLYRSENTFPNFDTNSLEASSDTNHVWCGRCYYEEPIRSPSRCSSPSMQRSSSTGFRLVLS